MAKRIDKAAAPRIDGTNYPPPFDAPCLARERARLGDAAGLTQFGVNLLRLPPGAWSGQRHWESAADEFVYVLSGEVVMVTDAGEEVLRSGDCAGFKANDPDGHVLQNRSDADATVLEVGTRAPGNAATYVDIDMVAPGDGSGYTQKDGTPYPNFPRRSVKGLTGMSNTRRLFGTDGIRGTANQGSMTAGVALRLGQAAGLMFVRGAHRHQVVIGKDTRLSGYMIEPALVAGFIGAGMDVTLVGPLPTPAIAMLTRSLRADLGVMISASHNTFEDNGIKLFGPDGFKLSDETEIEIESLMDTELGVRLAAPDRLGRAARLNDAGGRYIEAAKATFPRGKTLDGFKIVVDCANGAGYRVAPTVLWELGATIIPIGVDPDGFNINRGCGSTVPDLLRAKVLEHGADLGIALDGDADRLLLVDERGETVDGDQILALIARSWRQAGRLRGGGVVATVMSNLGLERFLAKEGLKLHRTKVGDRYVVETMRAEGMNIGGEQSGHVILSDYATTGDGLVAALQVLAVLAEVGRPASEVCTVFDKLPQMLRNVRFAGRSPLEQPRVIEAVKAAEARLGRTGRVLLRPSGTEPLLRVMAEGEDEALVAEVVASLCETIQSAADQAA